MSKLNNLLENLSFSKYEFPLISSTAIEQLDHLFLVIGNGYYYDPVIGPVDSTNNIGLLEKQNLDFEKVSIYHKNRYDESMKYYDELLERFKDTEAPEVIVTLVNNAKFVYQIPEYKVMERSYYFDYELVAIESINDTMIRINNSTGTGEHYRTPYPISEYSFISQVTVNDDPLLVELVVCTAKAWMKILDFYIENELYLPYDQANPLTFYQSLEYMNKSKSDLNSICIELEKNNA